MTLDQHNGKPSSSTEQGNRVSQMCTLCEMCRIYIHFYSEYRAQRVGVQPQFHVRRFEVSVVRSRSAASRLEHTHRKEQHDQLRFHSQLVEERHQDCHVIDDES